MNMPSPNQQFSPQTPMQRKPQLIAKSIADWVKAGTQVVLWLVVAAATLGFAYIALLGVLWAVNLGRESLGV